MIEIIIIISMVSGCHVRVSIQHFPLISYQIQTLTQGLDIKFNFIPLRYNVDKFNDLCEISSWNIS